jgi:hypothetical protein
METLLEFLKQVDAFEMSDSDDHILNNDTNEVVQKIIEEISGLASEVLVGDEGQCLWDRHELLKEAGYTVFPGERDRFGWLTGCIQTKKGVIVYG